MSKTVLPYTNNNEQGKKEQVAQMFDNIAHKYDFLNHFLSMNIDKAWRKKAIRLVAESNPQKILDIATGTGDLAIKTAQTITVKHITGIDISKGMLELGKEKVKKAGLSDTIHFELGDAENILFPDNTFDAAMVSFGVRNFENLDKGLSEIHRVLQKGGRLVVLEFSQPTAFPVKQLYRFYSYKILPVFGRLFSRDTRAYTYLPESVEAFPFATAFTDRMAKAGFVDNKQEKLSFGIATIYLGHKKTD